MDTLVIHSLYIPYMHICFLDMFHVFSLVCFLIYGVKRESGGDGSQSFGPIWHVSGPEMVFWRNGIMILHHFCWRSWKIKLFWPKTLIFHQKFPKIPKNMLKYKVSRMVCHGRNSCHWPFLAEISIWLALFY